MSPPSTNAVVTLGLLLIVIVATLWDLYQNGLVPPGTSISLQLLNTAKRQPILPFLSGILLGHLLWPQG